jgi:hypothetical protein
MDSSFSPLFPARSTPSLDDPNPFSSSSDSPTLESSTNSPPPLDDDKKLYEYCIQKSLGYMRDIPSSFSPSLSPFTSPKSLFTIERSTGKVSTTLRYTIRTKTKKYFYIFPWILYLQLKKTQRNDTSFFRETMEEDYMEKVLETMNYFYGNCQQREFTKDELVYLQEVFQELDWERDKEKNLVTRIIQISSSLKRFRSLISQCSGAKRNLGQSYEEEVHGISSGE